MKQRTQWISLADAARKFGVDRATMHAAVAHGRLPALRPGDFGMMGRFLIVRRADAARIARTTTRRRGGRALRDGVLRLLLQAMGKGSTLPAADEALDAVEEHLVARTYDGEAERVALTRVLDGLVLLSEEPEAAEGLSAARIVGLAQERAGAGT